MNRRRSNLIMLPLSLVISVFAAGCENTYVADAARSSVASFINSVITTAVTNVINPS